MTDGSRFREADGRVGPRDAADLFSLVDDESRNFAAMKMAQVKPG